MGRNVTPLYSCQVLLCPSIWLAIVNIVILYRATLLPVALALGVYGCRGAIDLFYQRLVHYASVC